MYDRLSKPAVTRQTCGCAEVQPAEVPAEDRSGFTFTFSRRHEDQGAGPTPVRSDRDPQPAARHSHRIDITDQYRSSVFGPAAAAEEEILAAGSDLTSPTCCCPPRKEDCDEDEQQQCRSTDLSTT